MKRLALCSILVLSTLAASARVVAAEGGPVFVSLGDSYSSGEGVLPFDEGTDEAGENQCHRSSAAYSRIFPSMEHGLPAPIHVACSGAVTADLTKGNKWGEDAQEVALTDETRLVTLTIGGNDIGIKPAVGFKAILESCVKGDCHAKYVVNGRDAVSDAIKKDLGPRLVTAYQRIADEAKNATVVVLGYPQIFPDPRKVTGNCYRVNEKERTWLRARTSQLTSTMAASVKAANRPTLRFVNALNAFEGREMCTKSPVVNGINYYSHKEYGAHPKASGHLILARLLAATLNLTPDLALTTRDGYDLTTVLASEGRIFKDLGWGSGPIRGWATGRRYLAYDRATEREDSQQYDGYDIARDSAWNAWVGGFKTGPVGSGFASIEDQYQASPMVENFNPDTSSLTTKAFTKRDLRGGTLVTSTPGGLVVTGGATPPDYDWMAASGLYLVAPSGRVVSLGTPPGDRVARLGAYDAKLNRIAVVSSWYSECRNAQTDILSLIPIAGGVPAPVELPPSPHGWGGWGVISVDFSPSGVLGVLLWERPSEYCGTEGGERRYFNQTQNGWSEDTSMRGAVYASTSSGGWRVKFTGSLEYRFGSVCTQPDKAWMVGPDGTTYFLGDDPSEALWNTSAGHLSASSSARNCLWRERST